MEETMANVTENQMAEEPVATQEATPAQDGAAQGATNPPAAPEKKGLLATVGGAFKAGKDKVVNYCTEKHVGTYVKGILTGVGASAVVLYTAAQVIAAKGDSEESTVVDASDFEVVDTPEETEATGE